MPRSARIVIPGIPHHVTQRGSRRLPTFLKEEDYAYYRSLIGSFAERGEVTVLAWCLMPNHVHFLLIPAREDSLRAMLGPLNRTYAETINRRGGWTGHLWQDRFASVPLDSSHTVAAARYIELNPVRANLVRHPAEYRWSSAISHLTGQPDGVTNIEASRELTDDWAGLLESGMTDDDFSEKLKHHQRSCRPMGSDEFLKRLSGELHINLLPPKRGRPRKNTLIP
jgi:putative transposase